MNGAGLFKKVGDARWTAESWQAMQVLVEVTRYHDGRQWRATLNTKMPGPLKDWVRRGAALGNTKKTALRALAEDLRNYYTIAGLFFRTPDDQMGSTLPRVIEELLP